MALRGGEGDPRVATVSLDGAVIWNATSGEALHHLVSHPSFTHSAVASPGGDLLATCGSGLALWRVWGRPLCCALAFRNQARQLLQLQAVIFASESGLNLSKSPELGRLQTQIRRNGADPCRPRFAFGRSGKFRREFGQICATPTNLGRIWPETTEFGQSLDPSLDLFRQTGQFLLESRCGCRRVYAPRLRNSGLIEQRSSLPSWCDAGDLEEAGQWGERARLPASYPSWLPESRPRVAPTVPPKVACKLLRAQSFGPSLIADDDRRPPMTDDGRPKTR